MRKVTFILGAGFSVSAGLPATNQLMDGRVWQTSRELERRVTAVLDAWTKWSAHEGTDVVFTEVSIGAQHLIFNGSIVPHPADCVPAPSRSIEVRPDL